MCKQYEVRWTHCAVRSEQLLRQHVVIGERCSRKARQQILSNPKPRKSSGSAKRMAVFWTLQPTAASARLPGQRAVVHAHCWVPAHARREVHKVIRALRKYRFDQVLRLLTNLTLCLRVKFVMATSTPPEAIVRRRWAERPAAPPPGEVSSWLTHHPSAALSRLPFTDGQHRLLGIATLCFPLLEGSYPRSTSVHPIRDVDLVIRELEPEVLPETASSDVSLVGALVQLVQAADLPLHRAFLARACAVLAQLVTEGSHEDLASAVAAPSDWDVLFRVLQASTPKEEGDDPLAAARLRGLQRRQAILAAEGGLLSVQQVAERLGLSRQAVDNRRKAGRLLALHTGRRGLGYPAWQFDERGVLGGLEETLSVLRVDDPWMRAWFFLTPDPHLEGRRALDALRAGEVDRVRRAAEAYGQQGGA